MAQAPVPERPVEELARIHRTLLKSARQGDGEDVAAVLGLGAAVLFHGLLEATHILPRHHLLDPAVVEELAADHARLARDLAALEELWRSDPKSPDLPLLTRAVFQHLMTHLERDARALYQPLERLRAAGLGGSHPPAYDRGHRRQGRSDRSLDPSLGKENP